MNNSLPLVSFLVTAYNSEKHLETTLNSLLKQTYNHIEIIIVDDGSKDGTVEILKRFVQRHERVNAFFPGRLGRAKALNYGLSQCNGKYIAVNDADDISMSNRIEKQVQFLEGSREYVLVGSRMYIHNAISGKRNELYSDDARPVTDGEIRKAFLRGQPIQHSSVLMNAGVVKQIGGYNESINFLLDRDIFLRLAQHGKLHNLEEVLISLGRSDQQYFRTTFNGRERIIQDYKYRIEAARIFKASSLLKVKIQLLKFWSLTAPVIKNLLNKTE